MTDRIHALTVHLDRDYRDDDVEHTMAAILQIKGVARVEPHVAEGADYMARHRVRRELQAKLHDAIQAVFAEPED